MSDFLVLNAAAVRELLPMAKCIELMKEAFRAEAEGRTRQPIRNLVPAEHGRGYLAWMPGTLAAPDWLGIKVMSIFPGNFGKDLGSHQGCVLLFDSDNGRPAAMIDAREITAIRTAAATAAATDILAPADAATLGIFGYGDQAETHVEAIRYVRNIERILVWGRNIEKARAFAAAQHGDAEVIAVGTAAEAAEADILCLTTAARTPYFKGSWLRPGHHVNAVGSSVATTSEVDADTIARSRVYVDFEESARELAGDLKLAWDAGVPDDNIIGSVGDVLVGRKPARVGAKDVTYFKSLGMIVEDLVSADFILNEARRTGAGTVASW